MKKLGLILVLALAACGGGGGGGGSSSNFAGSYLYTAGLVRDECNLLLGDRIDIAYRVDQDGDVIVVRNLSTGNTATGSTIGNGWLVSNSTSNNSCTGSTQLSYNGDESSTGGLAFVLTCPTIGVCTTEYVAAVQRD